jgi:hypothetical protein
MADDSYQQTYGAGETGLIAPSSGGGQGFDSILSDLLGFASGNALPIIGAGIGAIGEIFGSNPREEALQAGISTLQESRDYISSTPFSKEEIMGELLPQAQKKFRGAADVVAGRLGAATGEVDTAKGQATKDFYIQTLAPVIAKGEELAGQAISDFGKWYSTLDAQAKGRFLQSVQLELNAAMGLPEQNQFQRTITAALGGLNLGSTAGGNIAMANALSEKGDILSQAGQGGSIYG